MRVFPQKWPAVGKVQKWSSVSGSLSPGRQLSGRLPSGESTEASCASGAWILRNDSRELSMLSLAQLQICMSLKLWTPWEGQNQGIMQKPKVFHKDQELPGTWGILSQGRALGQACWTVLEQCMGGRMASSCQRPSHVAKSDVFGLEAGRTTSDVCSMQTRGNWASHFPGFATSHPLHQKEGAATISNQHSCVRPKWPSCIVLYTGECGNGCQAFPALSMCSPWGIIQVECSFMT